MQCSTRFDEISKVWSGPSSERVIDKRKNFGEIILENLDTDTERVVQVFKKIFFFCVKK